MFINRYVYVSVHVHVRVYVCVSEHVCVCGMKYRVNAKLDTCILLNSI